MKIFTIIFSALAIGFTGFNIGSIVEQREGISNELTMLLYRRGYLDGSISIQRSNDISDFNNQWKRDSIVVAEFLK